jgi:hypothetical protein
LNLSHEHERGNKKSLFDFIIWHLTHTLFVHFILYVQPPSSCCYSRAVGKQQQHRKNVREKKLITKLESCEKIDSKLVKIFTPTAFNTLRRIHAFFRNTICSVNHGKLTKFLFGVKNWIFSECEKRKGRKKCVSL